MAEMELEIVADMEVDKDADKVAGQQVMDVGSLLGPNFWPDTLLPDLRVFYALRVYLFPV